MRFNRFLMIFFLFGVTMPVFANDISLVSGFYKSDKIEDGVGRSEVSLGARFALRPSADQSQWFIRAAMASVSYSGDNAPKGGLNLNFGGGKIYFLRKFSGDIRSYLAWDLSYLTAKEEPSSTTELEKSGFLYAGHAGFRFDLSKSFYFDVDAKLFESALLYKEKTTTRVATVATQTERSRTEIYLKSFSGIDDVSFGVGYVF